MLAGHAAEAAALERAAMEALLPVLQQARGELNRDLARWINSGAGDARYTPQAYRNSLLAIDASMDAMNASLTPALVRVLGDFDGIARRLANTQTARELAMFAQPGFSDVLPDVPVRVAAGLVTSRNAPMARYETSAARYTGQVARDIRRELAVGVVRGESLTDLVTRLQRLGGPSGAVAVQGIAGTVGAVVEVIPEGLFNRYEYWAERLVRTELAHAHNEQLQDIADDLRVNEDMPDLTRRWDASSDGRLCPRCQDMHGVLADPKTDTFPGGIDNPPLHPNCRCRAGLWRPSWERFMSRDYRDPGGPDPVVPPRARPATLPPAARALNRRGTRPAPGIPVRPAPDRSPRAQPPRAPRKPRTPPVMIPDHVNTLFDTHDAATAERMRGMYRGLPPKCRETYDALVTTPPEFTRVAGAETAAEQWLRLLHELRDSLHITDADLTGGWSRRFVLEQNLAHMGTMPPGMYARLRSEGVRVYVGSGHVPDLDEMGHLRGVRPRGHPPGATWNTVGGCYSPNGRKVLIGESGGGAAIHESGHGIGGLLRRSGQPVTLNDDPEVIAAHARLFPRLSPYEKQGGLAGRQEFFAESINVMLTRGRARAVAMYDEAWVQFCEEHVFRLRRGQRLPDVTPWRRTTP